MKINSGLVSALGGLIVGALAFGFQSYNEIRLISVNMWLILGLGAFVVSLGQVLFSAAKPLNAALLVSFGVLMALIARIIYDTTFWDSTSHNLFPFEIIVVIFETIPGAFIGAYLGLLIKKLM